MSETKEYIWGTGRRKTSVARVRIRESKEGEGKFIINGHPLEVFFPALTQREMIVQLLQIANIQGKYDILVNVLGGGISGQSGAIILGIARALCKQDPAIPGIEEKLRSHGYLTRDSRMRERKKCGKRRARARFQFSKR